HTIGAGGGSIGWLDDGGLLRMGPKSAGAAPGPACYGRGGTRPTCTDADLVLGYLSPAGFLGGRFPLDEAAARAAAATLAPPRGRSARGRCARDAGRRGRAARARGGPTRVRRPLRRAVPRAHGRVAGRGGGRRRPLRREQALPRGA